MDVYFHHLGQDQMGLAGWLQYLSFLYLYEYR